MLKLDNSLAQSIEIVEADNEIGLEIVESLTDDDEEVKTPADEAKKAKEKSKEEDEAYEYTTENPENKDTEEEE